MKKEMEMEMRKTVEEMTTREKLVEIYRQLEKRYIRCLWRNKLISRREIEEGTTCLWRDVLGLITGVIILGGGFWAFATGMIILLP